MDDLTRTLDNIRYAASILCRASAFLPSEAMARKVETAKLTADISRSRHHRLRGMDWLLSDARLAAESGYKLSTIKTYRRHYAPETLSRYRTARKVHWELVDLSRTLDEICEETGCARRTVMAKKSQIGTKRLFLV